MSNPILHILLKETSPDLYLLSWVCKLNIDDGSMSIQTLSCMNI